MAEVEVEEEVEAEPGARSQRWKHEGQLDWMTENYGYDYDEMTPLDIVTVFALHRVPWRKSAEYQELVETHRTEVDEAKEERRVAAAERAADAKEAGKTKATKATKGATKAAAATKKPAAKATAATRKTTATKATGARKRSGSKAGANPFGG